MMPRGGMKLILPRGFEAVRSSFAALDNLDNMNPTAHGYSHTTFSTE